MPLWTATSRKPRPRCQGYAEIRIGSASRGVADILRHRPVGGEQRGYPARGKGTRLHLAVDATRTAGPGRSRLATSRPLSGTGLHAWEP